MRQGGSGSDGACDEASAALDRRLLCGVVHGLPTALAGTKDKKPFIRQGCTYLVGDGEAPGRGRGQGFS